MNELKVGLLTIAAIASFAIVTLKMTSSQTGFGDFIEYRTILTDASGIYEKSSIKVAGIQAGQITKIELNGSQALLKFVVREDIKITQFSILKIKSVGFLGDKYLDIYLGNPNAPRLKEDSFVRAEGGGGFEELGKDASDVLKDVKSISRSIRESLINEKNENVVKQIMENVKAFTASAKDVTASLKSMLKDNDQKFQDVIDNVNKVSAQLAYETDRYADGSMMHDLSDVKSIVDNAKKAMKDIQDVVADVKAGKGTVGRLLRDEEVIDQVSATLSGVNRLMNRVNNYQTDIGLFSGVNSAHGAHTQFDIDLYPTPERFFRLGVITNSFGPDVEKNTTTTTTDEDGDNEATVVKREVSDDSYKFNLQIGRRFSRWGVRAGVIESTGGLGVDYFLPDYGIRLTSELFDYQEDAGPNLRLLSELRMWNVLYTRLSAEDAMAKTDDDRSFTFSVGLRFNDEDLAAMLGLLAN